MKTFLLMTRFGWRDLVCVTHLLKAEPVRLEASG